MSLQQSRQMLRLAAGAVLFAAVATPFASAASVQVVVPNANEVVEGDLALGVGNAGGFLYQQLFLASEFATLPATHRMITGAYIRPDASVTQPGSATYDELRFRLRRSRLKPTSTVTVMSTELIFSGGNGANRIVH